ncbi:hypothetical protein V6N13_058598 [Hibiscus sabdariffa]
MVIVLNMLNELFLFENELKTTDRLIFCGQFVADKLLRLKPFCQCGAGVLLNDGADIADPCDEEGNGLQEEVYEVVVLPVDEIVASAEEKECCESKLQCVQSVGRTRTTS